MSNSLKAFPFVLMIIAGMAHAEESADHPLPKKQRDAIRKRYEGIVEQQTKSITANPKSVSAFSLRGDAYFFLGKFKEAVDDYEKMVELNPKLDASHWRRGIAQFYAGDYKKAAHQFEIYNTFDMVDRENGIWRFFSQAKAYGVEKARKNLLKYKKDDREPFPDVYKLFALKITPEQIVANIESAKIGEDDREVRRLYAHLYIGLNHALNGKKKEAIVHLRKAVANKWGQSTSGGPKYMWHVGRVHYELLTKP